MIYQQQPFPVLQNCPKLTRLINDVVNLTQTSVQMALMCILGALSTALQGSTGVRLPATNQIIPISLYLLTIADSGERKSTLLNMLMAGIKEFQQEAFKLYNEDLQQYRIIEELHKGKEKKLLKSSINSDEDIETVAECLLKLQSNMPKKPRSPLCIYEDVTPEGLFQSLYDNFPYAYFGTSEGGNVLKSKLMRHTSILNTLYSGDEINISTKTGGSILLEDIRLTQHIMVQPKVINDFIEKSPITKENGFWARNIVCLAPNRSGNREIKTQVHESTELKNFNEETKALILESYVGKNTLNNKVLTLEPEATQLWLKISNKIEHQMLPGGMYEFAKEHGSKLAEIVVRVAANLTINETPDSKEIKVGVLTDAINIVRYFSYDFLNLFDFRPQSIKDTDKLYAWVCRQRAAQVRYFKKNRIRQFGPLRDKQRLEPALYNLMQCEEVGELKLNGTQIIDLYPKYRYDHNKAIFDRVI